MGAMDLMALAAIALMAPVHSGTHRAMYHYGNDADAAMVLMAIMEPMTMSP